MTASVSLRRLLVLLVVHLVLAGSVVLAQQPARAAASSWCSDGAAAPCIASVTRNGAAITSADTEYSLSLLSGIPGDYLWDVSANLPTVLTGSEVWKLTFDMGSVIPRVGSARAHDASYTRSSSAGDWTMTFSGSPVFMTGVCGGSSTSCPVTATQEGIQLSGDISDYRQWTDASQRDAFFGLDLFSNVDFVVLPPVIDWGTGRMSLELGNSRYLKDGTTLFKGDAEFRLPFAMLNQVFGVDDPASLTPASLDASLSGTAPGGVSTAVDTPGKAFVIDVTNARFQEAGPAAVGSAARAKHHTRTRLLRTTAGVLTPGRPSQVHATRLAAHRGRLAWHASRSHGSRVRAYVLRCTSAAATVNARVHVARHSAATVRGRISGLRAHTPYVCRVRATSRAGLGPWSRPVRLRAHR